MEKSHSVEPEYRFAGLIMSVRDNLLTFISTKVYDMKQRLSTLILCMALMPAAVRAQKFDDAEAKAAQKDIEAVFGRIESALREDKGLMDRLSTELMAVQSEKDVERRNAGLKAYADKFKGEYAKFVAKGGVDMAKEVERLNGRYKTLEFKVANGYGIQFKGRREKTPAKGGSAGGTPATRTVQLSFNGSRENTCAAVSGGSVTLGGRNITSTAWSAVAYGGCESTGKLIHESTLPSSGRSVVLRISYSMESEATAVGILGAAICRSSARVHVDIDDARQNHRGPSIYESVVAPFLWVASYVVYEDWAYESDVTASLGKKLIVSAEAYSKASSLFCCSTTTTTKNRITKAELVITE